MSKHLTDNLNDLNDAAKSYLHARLDLMKLTVLNKLTLLLSYLVFLLVLVLFSALVIFLGSAAVAVWYGQQYGDYLTGIFLAIGMFVVITVILILLKNWLVVNPILNKLSEVLFEDELDTEPKEKHHQED